MCLAVFANCQPYCAAWFYAGIYIVPPLLPSAFSAFFIRSRMTLVTLAHLMHVITPASSRLVTPTTACSLEFFHVRISLNSENTWHQEGGRLSYMSLDEYWRDIVMRDDESISNRYDDYSSQSHYFTIINCTMVRHTYRSIEIKSSDPAV